MRTRKPLRMDSFDYSKNGAYFVTICTEKKECVLRNDVGANCVRPPHIGTLTDIGTIVYNELAVWNSQYDGIYIDKYVIMPNHIHLIIVIAADTHYGRTQFAPTLSRMVKQFKGAVTKKVGYSIWQRSFHDHIIRGKEDYDAIYYYIEHNHIAWEKDCYYLKK